MVKKSNEACLKGPQSTSSESHTTNLPEPLPDTLQIQLNQAKGHWLHGEWQRLVELDKNLIAQHPNRAYLALLIASAQQQLEHHDQARHWVKQALTWGADTHIAAQVLISCVHNTLGRIASLCEDTSRVKVHFNAAIRAVNTDDPELMAHTRTVREMATLGLLPQAADNVKTLLAQQELQPDLTQRATSDILKTELELLTHELSLALQRQQLYSTQQVVTQSETTIYPDSEQYIEQLKKMSVSQLGQDLWVLEKTGYNKSGFFVEFGATDGILLSNTYLLEKEFGWKGICAEPNPKFFDKLQKNRHCFISNACISDYSGHSVEFILAQEYGAIMHYANSDMHADKRKSYSLTGDVINLITISLHDFLKSFDAPKKIDYLSIDTEGSEYDILSTFPFEQWDIRLITVEHNFTEQRDKIFKLLTEKGYSRHEAQWDDWYYRDNI